MNEIIRVMLAIVVTAAVISFGILVFGLVAKFVLVPTLNFVL